MMEKGEIKSEVEKKIIKEVERISLDFKPFKKDFARSSSIPSSHEFEGFLDVLTLELARFSVFMKEQREFVNYIKELMVSE